MADTLPHTIYDMVTVGDVATHLSTYELTGKPAVFQGRAPSDVGAFPYGVFNLSSNENANSSDHYLAVELDLEFHWWDLGEGHSAETLQNIAREVDLIFDRQSIFTDDYQSMRAWKTGQTLFDEENEEDNVLHMVQLFTLRGYRKYLQTFLTT